MMEQSFREQGRKGNASGGQNRPALSANVANRHQVNDCVYYLHWCEGKQGGKPDYNPGYLGAVHNIFKQSLTIFFTPSKEFSNIDTFAPDFLRQAGFHFTKVVRSFSKLVFDYEANANPLKLEVKFKKVQIAKEWRDFIFAIKPEVCRNKGEEPKSFNEIVSPIEQCSPDLIITRIKSEASTPLKNLGDKVQQAEEKELKRLRIRVQELESQCQAEKTTKEHIERESQEFQRNSFQRSQREPELLETIQKLEDNLSRTEKQLQELTAQKDKQVEEMQKQKERLSLTVSNMQSENKQLSDTLRRLKEESRQQCQQCLQLEQTIASLKQANMEATRESTNSINTSASKLDQISRINSTLTSQNNQLKKAAQKHQIQFARLQKQLAQQAKELRENQTDYENRLASTSVEYQSKLADLTRKYEQSSALLESKLAATSEEESAKVMRSHFLKSVFNIGLLEGLETFKEYLVGELESFTNRPVLRTRFLFRFDPLNKVNFHAYIDHCANLAMVLRTSSGFLVAAFTESPFFPKCTASDGGLLLSLTNCRSFRCIEGRRAISYDDYYIIFGNSELRVKSLEPRVYSNFGITNGMFNSSGCKVDVLLGEGEEKEVDMDTYEIYQVYFD